MKADELQACLAEAAILPILTIRAIDPALETIGRLIAGGVKAIEIVFRTPLGPAALAEAKQRFPQCIFGAGTILTEQNLADAVAAKADFLVSPGLTPELAELVRPAGLPHIPGVQTASEVMAAIGFGYSVMKYYPSQPSNGLLVLADYFNIFPDVGFVPTDKIDAAVAPDYARLPNVVAIGGSWMLSASDEAVRDQITAFKAAQSLLD